MKRAVKAVILGSVTGVLGVLASMIPTVLELEENAGLDWLFTLRGPRTPPAGVVVVSIDKHSADALGLPAEPDKWPRSYHAELVNRLVAAGAAIIVLDIFFKEPRDPQGDAALATALDAASRVVLFAYTRKEITRIYDETGNPAGEMLTQRLVPPVAQIAESASALAPFPLPVFPVKVSQFWTFTPGTGDLPTLPVVALRLYASSLTSDLQDLVDHQIAAHAGNELPAALTGTLQTLRASFRNNPALAKRLVDALSGELQGRFTREQRILLQALVKMYGEPDSRYLNFYGPPQTVTTVPYIQALQPERPLLPGQKPVDLNGKAVFVGYSERLQPEQLDEFYTVFSQKNGLSLSGVEIAATAFANLLEDLPVTPLNSTGGLRRQKGPAPLTQSWH
jgi:adenylate cyclase